MIKCDSCPRCKDVYPGKIDDTGNHFYICGMSGNKVYAKPWKEKRQSGSGYIHHSVSGCGLYGTVEDALKAMTASERRRWQDAVGTEIYANILKSLGMEGENDCRRAKAAESQKPTLQKAADA